MMTEIQDEHRSDEVDAKFGNETIRQHKWNNENRHYKGRNRNNLKIKETKNY